MAFCGSTGPTSLINECLPGATSVFQEADWANYGGVDTRTTFDELGRARIVTLPDGQTTETSYDGRAREAIDQKRHKKRFEPDALGRTVWVREFTSTDPNWAPYAYTNYSYDVADQLVGVTDAVQNPTSRVYDPLGRKISMSDPDMGTWSYAYDPIGMLQSQTDATNQAILFWYDVLKRPVRMWHPAFWAAPSPSQPSVYDLIELRCAVDTNVAAAGGNPGGWTDPAIVAGTGVPVRAVHFTELQSHLQWLWTRASMGTIPQFTGGAIVGGSRLIKASDLADLRTWLAQYESSTYGLQNRARVVHQYDAYDGTSQFGRGRRTAMYDGCGASTWTYDQAGRVMQAGRTLDGTTYTTSSTRRARPCVSTNRRYPTARSSPSCTRPTVC